MIQIVQANNTTYNTDELSLELRGYMDQIAVSENLREQLVSQIYIITNIQKAINNNSIKDNIDKLLSEYNNSIASINGAILSKNDKLGYFDITKEKSSYEKQRFTMSLANKCKEVEVIFNEVAALNANAINKAKLYISTHQTRDIDYSQNISVNNTIMANKN